MLFPGIPQLSARFTDTPDMEDTREVSEVT